MDGQLVPLMNDDQQDSSQHSAEIPHLDFFYHSSIELRRRRLCFTDDLGFSPEEHIYIYIHTAGN